MAVECDRECDRECECGSASESVCECEDISAQEYSIYTSLIHVGAEESEQKREKSQNQLNPWRVTLHRKRRLIFREVLVCGYLLQSAN